MYITVEELGKSLSVGLRTVLTSEDGTTQDNLVIEEAIGQASSMIDSYASYRYIIPLSFVNEQIKAICSDIAIYRLFKRKDALSKEIIDNYKLAVEYLKDVSANRASIEGADTRSSNTTASIENSIYAKSSSDEPKFDDDNLFGWKIT